MYNKKVGSGVSIRDVVSGVVEVVCSERIKYVGFFFFFFFKRKAA